MSGQTTSLLEFENQIILDLFNENGLLVLCEGLGLERIFLHFLQLYSDINQLVFVLNTDQMQQKYFIEKLATVGVRQLPKAITSEININERKKMYLNGGVFFASSRILVMDFLVDRIPVHLVNGILVNKAHKMVDACQECFIMRLFRQKNKDGFIKAFTDNPVALAGGFANLEKAMKHLFCKKVFLWPRFHSSILATLEKHSPEVIEVGVELTESMRKIQSSLLEIVSACLRELKSDNPGIDTDDFTLENSLGKSFDRNIRIQLDPYWNQLSYKTKRLVTDLRALRILLQALSQYDCVTFLSMLESFSGSEKAFESNPGWIFLEASDILFSKARYRVFGNKKTCSNLSNSEPHSSSSIRNDDNTLLLEESPKLTCLKEILQEITEVNEKTASSDLGVGKVFICAGDMRGVYILKDFLKLGSKSTMMRLYKKFFRKAVQLDENIEDKKARTDEKASVGPDEVDSSEKIFKMKVLDIPETYLHALHDHPDPYSLTRILEDIQPRFVILYDNSVHFVRQLEIFKACNPGIPLRVYFLTYQSSAEEQIYLTALRREKEAFQSLIQEKSSMVIPTEREGKAEDDPTLQRGVESAYEIAGSSRKAGGQGSVEEKQVVVVDMREFNSELPANLYKRGIDIEPVTIDVGDYILTPDICVERKSLSDLIGSLNSGRLYSQCTAMSRYYKQPMLLIEFDANKAFSFQSRGVAGRRMSLKDLNQKLALLLLHFPKLRLAWCSSPAVGAQLFHELKMSRNQPDVSKAVAIMENDSAKGSSQQLYNSAPYDFLLKCPGIDSKNCRRILHHVKNLEELCQLSESQLETLLDSKSNAESLYMFLHKQFESTSVKLGKTLHPKAKRPFSSTNTTTKANLFGKSSKR